MSEPTDETNLSLDIQKIVIIAREKGLLTEKSYQDAIKIMNNMGKSTPSRVLKRIVHKKILTQEQVEEIIIQDQHEEDDLSDKKILFSLYNLNKSYQSIDDHFQALKDVSFNIYEGELLAILGFSGSGKSTLLNILGLLSSPDPGSGIIYRDTSYESLTDRQKDRLRQEEFGFIFQESHLLSHLSALENVTLPLRLQKYSNTECIEAAQTALLNFMTKSEKEHSKHFFAKKPSQLSGGQKQRIAAARAMVHNPKVIFADEPTGSLDHETGEVVMQALLETAKQHNTTVILVTHNHSQARQYCRRFMWMEGGKLRSHLNQRVYSTIQLVRSLIKKKDS